MTERITYTKAIAASIRENRIVTISAEDASAEMRTDLESAAIGYHEGQDVTEYWGGERPEDEWRVHVDMRSKFDKNMPWRDITLYGLDIAEITATSHPAEFVTAMTELYDKNSMTGYYGTETARANASALLNAGQDVDADLFDASIPDIDWSDFERGRDEIVREYGNRVIVADDGYAEVEYDYVDSLREAAEKYVADGDWNNQSSTDWVDVYAWERWTLGPIVVNGDRETFTVEIEAEEPSCDDSEHKWVSPCEVLGGLRENPGVRGHGAGVIIQEVCYHCGCLRTTNTWAQRPSTGEQGLVSIAYDIGYHLYRDAYNEWIESEKLSSNIN